MNRDVLKSWLEEIAYSFTKSETRNGKESLLKAFTSSNYLWFTNIHTDEDVKIYRENLVIEKQMVVELYGEKGRVQI